MVKNTFGGSKSKSFARKNNNNVYSNRLRLIQHPSEHFALVTKLFGGSICQVLCHDLSYKNAVIRGKFRGKGKRNNIISSGSFVLIGIRDWASDHTVDILEVYSSFELDQLKNIPSFPSQLIHSYNSQYNNNDNDNDSTFIISNFDTTYNSNNTISNTDTFYDYSFKDI